MVVIWGNNVPNLTTWTILIPAFNKYIHVVLVEFVVGLIQRMIDDGDT